MHLSQVLKAFTLNIITEYLHANIHIFQWSNEGHSRLMSQMNAEDKEVYNFDFRNVDWFKWNKAYCLGIKIYLLKEDMANLPKARKR